MSFNSIIRISEPCKVDVCGAPIIGEYRNDRKFEIFKFVQGYSTGAKVGRAFFHGAADIVTLGLWEFVGTPTEITFSDDETAFQVGYDGSDLVDEIIAIKKRINTPADPVLISTKLLL